MLNDSESVTKWRLGWPEIQFPDLSASPEIHSSVRLAWLFGLFRTSQRRGSSHRLAWLFGLFRICAPAVNPLAAYSWSIGIYRTPQPGVSGQQRVLRFPFIEWTRKRTSPTCAYAHPNTHIYIQTTSTWVNENDVFWAGVQLNKANTTWKKRKKPEKKRRKTKKKTDSSIQPTW